MVTAPSDVDVAAACLAAARQADDPEVRAWYLATSRAALTAAEDRLASLRVSLEAVEREQARVTKQLGR